MPFELCLVIAGFGWRDRVDADGVIAALAQSGDESAVGAASDLQHAGGCRWQMGLDEGPHCGEPAELGGCRDGHRVLSIVVRPGG